MKDKSTWLFTALLAAVITILLLLAFCFPVRYSIAVPVWKTYQPDYWTVQFKTADGYLWTVEDHNVNLGASYWLKFDTNWTWGRHDDKIIAVISYDEVWDENN